MHRHLRPLCILVLLLTIQCFPPRKIIDEVNTFIKEAKELHDELSTIFSTTLNDASRISIDD